MPTSLARLTALVAATALLTTGCSGSTPAPTASAGRAASAGAPGPSEVPGPTSADPSTSAGEVLAAGRLAPAGRDRWRVPDASLTTPPRRLVAGTGPRERVRVVAVREGEDRPLVEVTPVRGASAARAEVARVQSSPDALAVDLDVRVRATARSDDPVRPDQWGLDRLKAEELWVRQPGNGVTVAVVDSGVSGTHPDLSAVMVPGIDFVRPGGDGTADGNGHGTHVAGIVAAVANNRIGVAGVAQGVRILPVRVLDDNGDGWASHVAQGIVHAVDNGAKVVNLSLGGGSSTATRTAVQYALDRAVSVVAAAGNERAEGNPVTYPAAYPGVLGVAASDSSDAIAAFSNTGSYVDVAAPGVRIVSTYPGGAYAYMSGTSMATPFTAGVAALLRVGAPSLSVAEINAVLEGTATDLGPTGRDDLSGHGLIDPHRAWCVATACTDPSGSPTASPSTGPSATASPTTSPTASPSTSPSTSPAPGPERAETHVEILTRPRKVDYGGTVSGTAQVSDAETGTALADVPASVCHQRATDDSPTCESTRTDPDGRVAWQLRARESMTVVVTHPGTESTRASSSPVVQYPVAPSIATRVGDGRVVATLEPAGRRRMVWQVRSGGRWLVHERTRTSRSGTTVLRRPPPGLYRLRVPATDTLAATRSARLRVR